MSKEKPPEVRKAQLAGDKEALSRLGAIGASHRIQLEDLRAAEAERRMIKEDKEKLYSLSPEGDVLPPEPPVQ